MNAIRVHEFGAADQLRFETVEDPQPAPGEILIEIEAAGVNPVDTYIRSGGYSIRPALPYTPGFDAAGVVIALGDGCEGFKVGDRVYTARSITGTYAERCVCESKHVRPLPDELSFAEGAAIGTPYATAYRALVFLAKAFPGERVLIHGASGGVGIAAVQLARRLGMFVIATASTEAGRTSILTQGAHHVFDHSGSDAVEETMRHTEGRGVDVIVEMLANKNLRTDLALLSKRGRVIVVGSRGSIDVDMREAMIRDASVQGMLLSNATDDELGAIHAALFAMLGTGGIRPVLSRQFKMSEAAAAHNALLERRAPGKLVLVP